MAGKQGDASTRKFVPLQDSTLQRGGTRRKGMFCHTEITGYTTLAVSPTEELIRQAINAGATRREFTVWFGVDPAAGTIAVFAEKPGYPGAATINMDDEQKGAAFHLAPVFEKHPDLKPVTKVRPVITVDEDGGKQCLVIQLKGAPAAKVIPRKDENGVPIKELHRKQRQQQQEKSKADQAAAGKQAEAAKQSPAQPERA